MKKQFLFLFLLASMVMSCNKYNRLLKSTDVELKYEWGMKYYEEQNYNKALPLFDEIMPLFRGTERAQELSYRYAYCNYYLNDLLTSAYLFQKFYTIFPSSKYTEECMFMSAYCNYRLSPVYSLDQETTYESIKEFTRFRNTYPTSSLNDSALTLTNKMHAKLNKKAFENAKLFYTTENYKAAIVAMQNFLKDYPNSEFEKEANFLILRCSYLLALNSVIKKKEERINDTIDAYYNFVDNFDDEKFLKEAQDMYDSILKERDKLLKEDNQNNL